MTDDSGRVPANLATDAFAGTAEDYAKFRPPYPELLLKVLLEQVSERTRLLDLACGPGRIALDLAPRFDSVLAVDSEPEMTAVGERRAGERRIRNITWHCSRAEELIVEPSSLDLITIGEAFHRLDQRVVLESARQWLRPGGCIAIMGSAGILQGEEPWQRAVAELAREWTKEVFPDGWAQSRSGSASGAEAEAELIRAAGFEGVVSRTFSIEHAWSVDEVAGYLRTTSVCSRRIMGHRQPAFEKALREKLLAMRPNGVLPESLQFGLVTGRRP